MGQALRALDDPPCPRSGLLSDAFDASPEGMALWRATAEFCTRTPPSRSYSVTRIAQKLRASRWLIFGRTDQG